MCGIFALVKSDSAPVSNEELEAGINLLSHRGPDYQGSYCIDNIGIANCRLSIIDINPRSNQPMNYHHCWLSFNGAIYNYLELKKVLIELGYIFFTESDTEVVLASYLQWGYNCVDRFNGMWSFALFIRQKKII